jgi:hypothetical protein
VQVVLCVYVSVFSNCMLCSQLILSHACAALHSRVNVCQFRFRDVACRQKTVQEKSCCAASHNRTARTLVSAILAGYTKSHAGGNSASTSLKCKKGMYGLGIPQLIPTCRPMWLSTQSLRGRVVSMSIVVGGCCPRRWISRSSSLVLLLFEIWATLTPAVL